ncbi:Mur ligase domain-containing protein [Komagataeibacter rhaeticus]|nr:Mur ligase domain-containing protein [Komagataeibacter rhaeticus]
MLLPELLRRAGLDIALPATARACDIHGITADSRQAGPGMIFAALRGTHQDGRAYIPQAHAQGRRPCCWRPTLALPRHRMRRILWRRMRARPLPASRAR